MDTLEAAVRSIQLAAGVIAAVVGLSLGRLAAARKDDPAEVRGAAVGLAVAVVGLLYGALEPLGALGVVVMAVAGVGWAPERPWLVRAVAAAGGALLGAAAYLPAAVPFVIAAAAVVALPAEDPPEPTPTHRPRLDAVLLLASAGGIYLTVPDTELALVALGATVVLALRSLLTAQAVAAGAPHLPVALLLLAGVGGVGRPASYIGALGCVGLLVASARWRLHPAVAVGLHLVVVAVSSRAAGLQNDIALAAGIVSALTAAAAAVLVLAVRER